MRFYKITDYPLTIHGLNHINAEKNEYWRLTGDILEALPHYNHLGRRSVGGRVRFKTNSEQIFIKYCVCTEKIDRNIGLNGAVGIDVYECKGIKSRFIGQVCPTETEYKDTIIEGVIYRNKELENITINLPRNEQLSFFEIAIDDDSIIEVADEYSIKSPIIYYGSSITEGGCASRVGCSYSSMLSRWLDADYFNYGFSGNAKGEEVFAQYISKQEDISLFVYDYDHNAPTPEHLENTHKNFLDIVRASHKNLPIIILTRPDFDKDILDSKLRREIIYSTYCQYVENGDKNIYFIDGEEFFGEVGREECTVDNVHPTVLGFFRMAEKIYPLAKEILY